MSFSYYNNGSPNLVKKFFYRFSRIAIPYWAVTSIFYLILRILNNLNSQINFTYSFYDLTMYILLLRNFTRESWYMFVHLWFIPVIISYYLIFPLLIKILQKIGRFRFLCLSIFVTYCTFGILISTGHKIMRQSSNLLYYLPIFSLGIVLGNILFHEVELFKRLLKIHAIYIGFTCLIISALMRQSIIFGNINDMFTGIGLFLTMVFIINWIMPYIPKKGVYFINNFYKYTYLTYLIHFPLIKYFLYPLFRKYNIRLNFLFLIIPGLLFSVVLLFISKAILNYKKIFLRYGIKC